MRDFLVMNGSYPLCLKGYKESSRYDGKSGVNLNDLEETKGGKLFIFSRNSIAQHVIPEPKLLQSNNLPNGYLKKPKEDIPEISK